MSECQKKIIVCIAILGLLLTVILIPLSISHVDYYEYGLNQFRVTGSVDTTHVYAYGRYTIGPSHKFVKYQADAQYVEFSELSVFSAGGSNISIGLEFLVDIVFTFLVKQDEVGQLHIDLASSYGDVALSRAKEAIKNEAIYITFTEYFQDRKVVEERFRKAVQSRWDSPPSMHCLVDQFHLGRIRIPDSVASKQLESVIQNERNSEEQYAQQAQVEREKTNVEVNAIILEMNKTLRTAQAQASFVTSKAQSEATRILAQAEVNGTALLFDAADIHNQADMMSYSYIRALRNREKIELDVSYLTPDNILRTRAV